MLCALYIDPSQKIGSSFSQEEKSDSRRWGVPPFPAGSLPEKGSRENDDLSFSQAPEYSLRAGLLWENDKSTGKAARNLDKILRLARVLAACLLHRIATRLP